ncbi:uncharacterized protein KD926_007786 [Aspergillus affinis]|uniref:uncharacterized protein n=1 Tax=Aspergillus affinis TaxID=1070780 RepID=UPI0022FEAAE6|nr:uncharacterized protein KD926_007786 [Aspergillus affinis]KAI9040705.1 hypothetical protein KD926_007786 [Aspergillus affinis]
MNWTGGRLHRHSNNSHNANSKNRIKNSQQFRSKITKDSNWIPFSRFPNSTVAGELTEGQVEIRDYDPTQESSARLSHLQSHPYECPPLESFQQSQPVSRLDSIKHQLLNTRDWAAVAVSKPLEVAFTRTEEIERFGKRRKLTDADRRRLADAENIVSRIERPFRKTWGDKDTASEMRTIKNLNIRINGRKVPAESLPSESSSLQANESSQSMLLGHESACSEKPETVDLPCFRNGEGSAFNQGPEELGIPDQSPLCLRNSVDTGPRSPSGILDVVASISADEEVSAVEQMSSHNNQNDSSAHECQALVNRRRFTIDDQVDQMFADNDRRLNSANSVTTCADEINQERQEIPYNTPILSSKTLKVLDCYARRTTHHLAENLLPPVGDSNDQALESFHDIRAAYKSTYREKDEIPILFKPHGNNITLSSPYMLGASTSPTKIFGQPVELGDNNDCGAMRSIWNTDRDTSIPNSSAKTLNETEIVSTQFKSPRMIDNELSQDADPQNQIMFQTQRPGYHPGSGFAFRTPKTMLHSPATLLEGFLQYDQNAFGQGHKQAESVEPPVGYRDNLHSIERFYAKRISSSHALSSE